MIRSTDLYCLLIVLMGFPAGLNAQIGSDQDSMKLLRATRLEISINTLGSSPELSDFSNFASKFQFGNRFLTSAATSFRSDTFQSSIRFSGFHVGYVFRTKLFNNERMRERSRLTMAFEAGRTTAELYRVVLTDTSRLSYSFESDIFRISFGYRYFLTKKDRRFKVHVGLETIHEVNISASIKERRFGSDYVEVLGERKLFAAKGYALYLNFPVGFNYRFSKKTIVFLYLNYALGAQNIDPFRISTLHRGSRFGFSFAL